MENGQHGIPVCRYPWNHILYSQKPSFCPQTAGSCPPGTGIFFRVAADKGDTDSGIKGAVPRKMETGGNAFGMDILRTEQEILSPLPDMGHAVPGAETPVTRINIFYTRGNFLAVNHGTESAEFILFMDGLQHCICVSTPFQVIKSSKVHAVKAFCGMAFGNEIFRGGKPGCTEKGK